MGRTQGYDTAEVVGAARNLFWQRGFDAVSVADVQQVTGLSRSSLYHAFGSMRGLFDAAVTDYLDTVVRPRLAPLRSPDVAPSALVDYLTGLSAAINRLGDGPEPTGCLLVGTAATSLGDDSAVRQVVAAYHAELLEAVTAGVRARYPDIDELGAGARARIVTGSIIAAMTLARVDRTEAMRLLDATVGTLTDDHA
ncbi:TetR/AcrR family transcriptional regulator [Gordonia rhizosphera]|uniref:Putative TetR family transcriptional regulator n=1 Tax=Gordonia rhizosphera NBRC 16068 TaxID=1108045 RepID=K6WIG5_9ACTN|nr:TetR/AcrR family transcriptional regulator [Gordonia rhizosphera]GAB91947.1 putative TetR family transcriptional regulator [Gordonia rhizosphera NBRC 16068]